MKKLSDAKKSVLGNMIIRQTMGGIRKEDKIKDKDTLKVRIKEEYEKQNSKETHKLDLTMLDVSLVEDMSELFYDDCSYLESIDVSNWDVSNVKNMKFMFCRCKSLDSIDVSKWNMSNVYDMGYMFYGCESLKSVDVSKWNVSNVRNMSCMFFKCSSLESIDVSNWDVSNVKDMYSMFYKCSSLESIDVSNWDVGNVEDMDYMFKNCKFDYKKEGNRLIRI